MVRSASPLRQWTIVVLAYAAAFVAAWLGTQAYIAATPGVDRHGAGGMTAFGDSMLFLAILAVASVPATCLGLYYLRPHRRFWQAIFGVTMPVAATALLALVASLPPLRHSTSPLVMLSPIRVLLAPMFGLAFLLFAAFAPAPLHRKGFLVAFLAEALTFSIVVLLWTTSADVNWGYGR